MAYGDFKDLNTRTATEKVLCDKANNIAKNPKYDGYHRGLASMVCKCFDKKTSAGVFKNEIVSNQELAEDIHKPIIRKFEKRKVHSSFADNIWGFELADMQLISKFNKGFKFLLYVIDIYSKHAWVTPLKDKESTTIINTFQKNFNESDRKPNEIWVDEGSKVGNRSMKSFLQNNDIETYSTRNEGKSFMLERFIRTLKNKIYKYMTLV